MSLTHEQKAAAEVVTQELQRRYPRWGFKWAAGLPTAEDPRLAVQSDWVLAATLAQILRPLLEATSAGAAGPTALPVALAPRDGTMLRLLVDYSHEANAAGIAKAADDSFIWPHTSFADTDGQAWTVGFNSFDDTGEDEWQFVGWNWSQDCFTEGHGTVVGWRPFHGDALEGAIGEIAAERRRQVEVEGFTTAHDDAHRQGEMAAAAAAYAFSAYLSVTPRFMAYDPVGF